MATGPVLRGRWRTRAEDLAFVVLILAAAALALWLGERHHRAWDWTAAARNTLSAPSARLLRRIDGPIRIVAFAREKSVARKGVAQLVARYQRARPDITLEFVDPDREPARARNAGVTADGELVVEFRGRSEHVLQLTEQELTNALRRATHEGQRFIAFLTGHGERDLLGHTNYDLGTFGKRAAARGYTLQPLDLAALGAVPDNASMLVISNPATGLLPRELSALEAYIDRGGRLLWLADPGGAGAFGALAQRLGVGLIPGVVVDPASGLGARPTFVPVTDYGAHPALAGFASTTLFVTAAAIEVMADSGWHAVPLARSGLASWAERDSVESPHRDPGREPGGPLTLAVALERDHAGVDQRVVMVGDGDFLANAYLGNGANLELGLRLIDWLAGDDGLIDVPPISAPDLDLELGRGAALTIAGGAILGLPALLLAAGLLRWRSRRRR